MHSMCSLDTTSSHNLWASGQPGCSPSAHVNADLSPLWAQNVILILTFIKLSIAIIPGHHLHMAGHICGTLEYAWQSGSLNWVSQ